MGVDTRSLPAGDERREQLRRNADELAEQAEESPLEGISEAKLEEIRDDHEIRQKYEPQSGYNRLRIKNAQPGYVYCLVCTRAEAIQVDMKKTEMVEDADGYGIPVWEVVSGDMPEAPDWRDVNGFRRVGDTILMRARKDRYLLLERQRKAHQEAMMHAGDANLLDLEQQMQRRGHGVKVTVNSPLSDPALRREATRAAARGIGKQKFDEMLREGTVPGMQVRR